VDFDVVVVGAGFSGLYMLHKLRELGFSARVYEMGDGVGGTWFWNRYPGARCDVESIEYSFSFSDEIQQEWTWTEVMPAQPEVEAYLNFVCDKLDLRRDIQFETRVTSAVYDESTSSWTVETDRGDTVTCGVVITAVGCLSAPLEPAIKGLHSFEGVSLYTNRFPKEGFDFTGLRVAVIGTGSSGVQSIPVIAERADHLYVIQRSAAYTLPSNTRPLKPGELDELKANYPEIRRAQKNSIAGTVRFGAFSAFLGNGPLTKIVESTPEERTRALDEKGWLGAFLWSDVMFDMEANKMATELYAEMIRRVVKDAETAASLVPQYPFGCKRVIIDVDYFQTFNRDNVTLIDLRKDPLVEITPSGFRTESRAIDVDVIVLATGFDAMTGALKRIDIVGRDGRRLADEWADGPRTYLGLQVAGFPNLFTITGPGSPSVLSNMVTSIEQHVDWIADVLVHMREQGRAVIEPTIEAQDEWVAEVAKFAFGVRVDPSCASWYLGANVPGKPRVYMPYSGGVPTYRVRGIRPDVVISQQRRGRCRDQNGRRRLGSQLGGEEPTWVQPSRVRSSSRSRSSSTRAISRGCCRCTKTIASCRVRTVSFRGKRQLADSSRLSSTQAARSASAPRPSSSPATSR
jgi:cation diffusion facilitator CzcD-associated flavoprotein CzcO